MLLPVVDASAVNGIIVPAAGHLDSFNAPGSRLPSIQNNWQIS
jgi:hypothetical protein